jgi:hypothetical protein
MMWAMAMLVSTKEFILNLAPTMMAAIPLPTSLQVKNTFAQAC